MIAGVAPDGVVTCNVVPVMFVNRAFVPVTVVPVTVVKPAVPPVIDVNCAVVPVIVVLRLKYHLYLHQMKNNLIQEHLNFLIL
jgi:hypothetical protein